MRHKRARYHQFGHAELSRPLPETGGTVRGGFSEGTSMDDIFLMFGDTFRWTWRAAFWRRIQLVSEADLGGGMFAPAFPWFGFARKVN